MAHRLTQIFTDFFIFLQQISQILYASRRNLLITANAGNLLIFFLKLLGSLERTGDRSHSSLLIVNRKTYRLELLELPATP